MKEQKGREDSRRIILAPSQKGRRVIFEEGCDTSLQGNKQEGASREGKETLKIVLSPLGEDVSSTMERCGFKERLHRGVNEETTSNLFFEGDNLEVMQRILPLFKGKIKVVYLDPPYNTHKRLTYHDSFSSSKEKDNNPFARFSSFFLHHSAWMEMMYPRLLLAHQLLREDGVIFISIDDRELCSLQLLCNEIFSERDFLGNIIIQTTTDNNPTQIATCHEYILCYAKDISQQGKWSIPSEAAKLVLDEYKRLKSERLSVPIIQERLRRWIRENKDHLPKVAHYNHVDEKGVYSISQNSSNTRPDGYQYDIIHPITHKPCSRPAYGWRWKEDTFLDYAAHGEVEWGRDETTQPHIKKRLETATENLSSIIYAPGRTSTNAIERLFGIKKIFDCPKPLDVIKRILEFTTHNDDIILDAFAGSATTAQAVMELNAKDDGRRHFIMIQTPEHCPPTSNAAKNGYHTICDIAEERIRRAGEIISDTHKNVDVGFKVYQLIKKPNDTK